jgi:lipoic acid synthetase
MLKIFSLEVSRKFLGQKLKSGSAWPAWLKKRIDLSPGYFYTRETINSLNLNTVCRSAHCPNLSECFSRRQAAFLILGNTCTRSCRFCAVKNGLPGAVDQGEPGRIAEAVKNLGLIYAVITSVTRDDLKDGGAECFAETIKQVRLVNPRVKIEVLTPDFQGSLEALEIVLSAEPDVFNHNLETVPRLYSFIRPQAEYRRSLNLLALVKEISPRAISKSGLMLGLGEREDEILDVLKDLMAVKCDILTLGQYLKPKEAKAEVEEFILPAQFKRYEDIAKGLGFKHVLSGPWARSSYFAGEIFETAIN